MISLITMGQGNPIALKRTIESVYGVCDEVVFGDVCIFDEDSAAIAEMKTDIPLKIISLPFNFIFKNGFSAVLNEVASHSSNDLNVYLNVAEVIASSLRPVREAIEDSPYKNCFYIDHATEKHHWWRVWDKKSMAWAGLIHEEIYNLREDIGIQGAHEPLFRFADTDKDMVDPLKAKVMNDIKELTYFQQLMTIVDYPEKLGATNRGWLTWAQEQYDSMRERIEKKGIRHRAFVEGDKNMYLKDVATNPEFEKERFESSLLIEYQGDKKYLL